LGDIIDIEMNILQKRLTNKDVTVSLTEKAKQLLVKKGYQPEMGARPLKRMLEQMVEDPLAERLLSRPDQKWSCTIDAKDDELCFKDKVFEEPQDNEKIPEEEEAAPTPQT
jgi:ATP-dependent Clp protease ATP-binding subunit ClpC